MNTSVIIIIIVVICVLFLIYSQTSQPKFDVQSLTNSKKIFDAQHYTNFDENNTSHPHNKQTCHECEYYKSQYLKMKSDRESTQSSDPSDIYSDPIKNQDLHTLYDPLNYPRQRLPREILERYKEYYEKNGIYPPFNQETRPLFDNPILAAYLVKIVEENEPNFGDNIPNTVPLFKVKSQQYNNKYFYYVIEQRHLSKIELKIPLDNVKIDGKRYENGEFYGLPEIGDDSIIENISIYPGAKFRIKLYKSFHFP